MPWVDTGRIETEMVNLEPLRNRPNEKLISKAVRIDILLRYC